MAPTFEKLVLQDDVKKMVQTSYASKYPHTPVVVLFVVAVAILVVLVVVVVVVVAVVAVVVGVILLVLVGEGQKGNTGGV